MMMMMIWGLIYEKSFDKPMKNLGKVTTNLRCACDLQRILVKTYDELTQNLRQQFISRKSVLCCLHAG